MQLIWLSVYYVAATLHEAVFHSELFDSALTLSGEL